MGQRAFELQTSPLCEEAAGHKRDRQPAEPTEEEIRVHSQTHWPNRSWCSSCTAGPRRADGESVQKDSQDALTIVGMDCGFLGAEVDAIPSPCGKDLTRGCLFFYVALPGRDEGERRCKSMVEQFRMAGHRRRVLLCESELATISFLDGVAKQLSKDWGSRRPDFIFKQWSCRACVLGNQVGHLVPQEHVGEGSTSGDLLRWTEESMPSARDLMGGRRGNCAMERGVSLWGTYNVASRGKDMWSSSALAPWVLPGDVRGEAITPLSRAKKDMFRSPAQVPRLLQSRVRDAELFLKVDGTLWRLAVRAEAAPKVLIDACPVVPESTLPEALVIPSVAARSRKVYFRLDQAPQ